MESTIRRRTAQWLRHASKSCTHRQILRAYSSATSKLDIYDVVCVGGGPAGLSLLTALRSNPSTSNLRVALVEAQDLSKVKAFSTPPTQFSNRCSSLTFSSVQFLHEIGAWDHLQQDRMTRYRDMKVWDGVTGARIDFTYDRATRGGGMACMVENLNLTSGLLKRLDQLGGVATFDQSKVESITFGEEADGNDLREWPVVHLAGGKQLHARLLVGADGANSPVRAFANIGASGWDYDRHGVVATLQLASPDHDYIPGGPYEAAKVAYQRFLPTGPVAMLPMPGNVATLVWSTTPQNATKLKSLAPKDFMAMVNAAFRLGVVDLEFLHTLPGNQNDEVAWRLRHTPLPVPLPAPVVGVQAGSVASFPLRFRHADTYVSERVALVGDAAHTVHPLAGQGLNMGLGDVQSLAREIGFATEHGLDVGATMSLEGYNADRYAGNHILMGVCDKLHKIYSVGSGPLVGLRSLGLRAVDALGPVKGFLMERAAGRSLFWGRGV